ncbi:MAG TPA: ABC transporter substrate-binding protein [Brevibacterium sp.]|nr:ABC transporter substrate-binding protein [Brevibacterium sp.]
MSTPTRHTRRLRLLGAAAASALVLAACGSGDADTTDGDATGADDPSTDTSTGGGSDEGERDLSGTIRAAYLPTGSALPMFLTAEKYADEVGITIEMIPVNSGNEALTGIATGQYELGFAGIGSAAYNAFDEGLPVSYVAPMHMGYVEDYFTLSSTVADSFEAANSLAEDMSDYAGENFAVNGPGVVTEALLGFALERMNLSTSDINVDFIPFPDQVLALANGAVVGGILSEPFTSQAEANGSAYRPWETPDEPPLPMTGILYNTEWAEEHPGLADAYMEAFLMSARELNENGWDTEEMLQINEEYTGADPEIVAASRQHHIDPDLNVDLEVTKRYQEFYMEQGQLNYSELIPEEQIWNFSWRDRALANS